MAQLLSRLGQIIAISLQDEAQIGLLSRGFLLKDGRMIAVVWCHSESTDLKLAMVLH